MATSQVLKTNGQDDNVKPRIGESFTAYGVGFDDNSAVTFQWSQCDTSGGTYTHISGATGPWFIPKKSMGGVALTARYLKCTITGNITGVPQGIVSHAVGPMLAQRSGGRSDRSRTVQRMKRGPDTGRTVRVAGGR